MFPWALPASRVDPYDASSLTRGKAMKQHSKAGGRREKKASPTRAARQNAGPDRRLGATELAEIERRLTRERDEALEWEKASAEVLRTISTSPGELRPIFQAMLENAVRICEAVFANLYMGDADGFHMIAAHHDSVAYVAARMSDPLLQPPPDAPLGRLAITKKVVQVADISALPSRDHPFCSPVDNLIGAVVCLESTALKLFSSLARRSNRGCSI